MAKSRGLNGRLVTAENKANELAKKYEESKRNYMRIREERERLKAELDQAKSASGLSTGEASITAAQGDSKLQKPAVNG